MSQELKIHRCCFTGHRPEKLTADSAAIKEALATEVDKAIADAINLTFYIEIFLPTPTGQRYFNRILLILLFKSATAGW